MSTLTTGEPGSKISYKCAKCNCVFFSVREVTEHKAMTGHVQYFEQK